ncbi:hypothetical protein IW140_005476 [Coemansia sp. RSA 1813]|nr:hypothetical protein EV178_005820 [Coemansia sp. RSA 1646]KAJ1768651.1 hypothetical protein LPJ74_004713 [Coemansia sp. RSA 1843]KAJ2086556.1 hypothetical protein IW138_005596 [Coemansia sp. RSA 986]KAJ2211221.1 hypothetical protein EV179_005679 [Coemansia sp. RSA 487]KAJ2565046.1 hypothetical protein IW140_005476 [Coemansia sp. RSA 1813]
MATEGEEDELARESISLDVVWKGSERYTLRVSRHATVLSVKALVEELTTVDAVNQKLLGLVKGKLPKDHDTLAQLGVSSGVKVRLVGTPAANRLRPPHEKDFSIAAGDVIMGGCAIQDDDDADLRNSGVVIVSEDCVQKLDRIHKTADVRIINNPRTDRKLVVLDLDHTILDCSNTTGNAVDMARPGLHEFLSAVYPHYDIIVWSQTKWFYVESKMTMLGMLTHPRYKLVTALDISSMIYVDMRYKGKVVRRQIKPLELIWLRFPEHYGPHNTIHVDDLERNFALNWQNGLKIKRFRHADRARHPFRYADTELYKLAEYLVKISGLRTLEELDHTKWKDYKK